MLKFDKNGKFIKAWGKMGPGPATSISRTHWPSIRKDASS